MALRKTAAVIGLAALLGSAPFARAQTPRTPQRPTAPTLIPPQPPDALCREFVQAFESKDTAKARALIKDHPKAARFVLERFPLSHDGQKTAFAVRREILQEVMSKTVDALPPEVRDKVISLEVGGSAGKQDLARLEGREAPAFQPRKADLDWQIRAETDEDARKAVEVAEKIMKEMDIPSEFGIHVFPALRTRPPMAGTTAALTETQRGSVEQMIERLRNPESGLIDTADVVELDHHENGVGYEIDPETKKLTSRPKPVSKIYEERGYPPPEPTPETAFGRAANEYSKFEGLALEPKRVLRAREAFQRAGFDVSTLPPEEQKIVDLAERLRAGPDAVSVLEKWARDYPKDIISEQYTNLVQKDHQLRTKAAVEVLTAHDVEANAMLRHVMERTLEARVTEIEVLQTMTDSQFVDYMEKRSAKDPVAKRWLETWMKGSARESHDMLKAARESLFEAKQQALVESFTAIDADTRGRLIQQPNFAERAVVRNAAVFAEILSDNLEGLDRLRTGGRAAPPTPEQAALYRRASLQFGKLIRLSGNLMAVDSAGGLGQGTHRGGQLLMGMAAAGTLWDAYDATIRAYEEGGGDLAASVAFLKVVGANAAQIAIGAAVFSGAQRASYMVEVLGWLPRGATGAATAAILARDIVRMSQALMTRVYQRYVIDSALKTALDTDPKNEDSFFAWADIRPEYLAVDLPEWVRRSKGHADLTDVHEMLVAAVNDYLLERGGDWPKLRAQMLAPLDFELTWNLELLAELGDVMRTDVPLASSEDALDRVLAEERELQRQLQEADAELRAIAERSKRRLEEDAVKAAAEKAQADAEAARRERRDRERKEAAARAKKEAEEKKKAEAEALKKQQEQQEAPPAPPPVKPATSQSRLDQLRAQKEEEDRLRAEAAAEARREAEAREAERRREAQEAALLAQVQVRLRVPASLQPGGQGSIEVSVSAPKGLALAGRHVTVVVNPGHTDERAVRINGSGYGRTVYSAPAGYNGYVRVQASLSGYGGASRTFAVGKVVAPPPADTPPVTPPKPVPPTVPVPSTPAPSAPTLSPAGLPAGDFTITLSGENDLSGRLEVRGGRAAGRISHPLSGPGISGTQELTFTACTYDPSTGVVQGPGALAASLSIQQGDLSGSVATAARVDLRLELKRGGSSNAEVRIIEVTKLETTNDLKARPWDVGDRFGLTGTWSLVPR